MHVTSNNGVLYQDAIIAYKAVAERILVNPNVSASFTSDLLKAYHPDYLQNACGLLRVGGNRDAQCHHQLVDALQSHSHLKPADITNMPVTETDILVIGGGGAGCAAALTAAQQGSEVILATKLRLGDSNTVMAEGGIQASINKGDSPQQHFDDILSSANQPVNKQLVADLVMDAPDVLLWLIEQGMQFDLDDHGNMCTRRAGGASQSRVVFCRDYTGLELMRVLKESIRNSQVDVWNYAPAIELTTDSKGQCTGAVLLSLEDNQYTLVKARSVILATGGLGRMHLNNFPTSNHLGATGDGLVLAYRIGARLRDLETFQYHPSGLIFPASMQGVMVTEGIRSSGAYLLNAQGQRFIDELESRDIVSAAIIKECRQGRGVQVSDDLSGVWLDTPGLELRSPGILNQRFPKLIAAAKNAGIDPRYKPLLIYPTLHYQNGGAVIDQHGQSTVKGLYCVGEVSGGIHGKNRLMGNSLLEIISFGRKAGQHAALSSPSTQHGEAGISHLIHFNAELQQAQIPLEKKSPVLFPEYTKFEIGCDFRGSEKI